MRHYEQLALTPAPIAHLHARELETMSALLDEEPRIAALAEQDLLSFCKRNPRTGRPGLTGDQVIRMAIVRQMNSWTYEELAFHLADSSSYRTFCRVSPLLSAPSKSAVADNIRRLRPATLRTINDLLVQAAARQGIERGRTVRIDSTVVEAAIHAPTDSSLLYDGIRALLRLLREAERLTHFSAYHTHVKRAKRRLLEIQHTHASAKRKRRRAYRDLITLARATADYAASALAHIEGDIESGIDAFAGRMRATPTKWAELGKLRQRMSEQLSLLLKVIDQAARRVLHEESVPAEEKVVSIFEPHADVIVKDRRETYYGHKIFITGGASGLVTDCAIVKGNPADSSWATPMLRRQQSLYGRVPRQASFDGGFASKDNLAQAKALGVKDVCFSKRRGLAVLDMVKSSWVYRKLKRFRAGIESVISLLKRAFGLDRCTWKGERGFLSYVRMGVIAANLLTLARHRLA